MKTRAFILLLGLVLGLAELVPPMLVPPVQGQSFVVPSGGGISGSITGGQFFATTQFGVVTTNVGIKESAQVTNLVNIGTHSVSGNASLGSNLLMAASYTYQTNVAEPSAPSAVSGGAGGNSGDYSWAVSYVTANGETAAGNASDAVELSSERATVTIPTSGDVHVISRNVYRTVGDGSDLNYYFLTNINNNSTTSFSDNIPNAALVMTREGPTQNTTAGAWFLNGFRVFFVNSDSVYLGRNAGSNDLYGFGNVGLGYRAMEAANNSISATAVGEQALLTATNVSGAVAAGNHALRYVHTATFSVAIGQDAIGNKTNSSVSEVGIGRDSLFYNQIGQRNTAIGDFSGESLWFGSNNVILGAFAGPTTQTVADHTNLNGVILIGYRAYAISNNIVVIGGTAGGDIDRVFIGSGATNRSPRRVAIHSTSGMGTDNAGADLEINAGQGTGSGAGGNIKFGTAAAGSSGATHNPLAYSMVVSNDGTIHFNGTVYGLPSGTGDMFGPASVTANQVVLFGGTGGDRTTNSPVTIDPVTGAVGGVGNLNATGEVQAASLLLTNTAPGAYPSGAGWKETNGVNQARIEGAHQMSFSYTNRVGVLEVSAASVVEFPLNQLNELMVTNPISGAITVVATNGTAGSKFRFKIRADGTDRVLTVVPNTGQLISNQNSTNTAMALSFTETIMAGFDLEGDGVIDKMQGTNTLYLVTRQSKR